MVTNCYTHEFSVSVQMFDDDEMDRDDKKVWNQFKIPKEDRLEEDRQRRIKVSCFLPYFLFLVPYCVFNSTRKYNLVLRQVH